LKNFILERRNIFSASTTEALLLCTQQSDKYGCAKCQRVRWSFICESWSERLGCARTTLCRHGSLSMFVEKEWNYWNCIYASSAVGYLSTD